MYKLSKAIKGIAAIIKNPWLLNNVLADDALWQSKLSEAYNMPNGFPTVRFSDICTHGEETLDHFSFLDGGSLPTDLILLKQLCRRFDQCSYFEIGTWRGESVANVSQVAPNCFTLNLSPQAIIDKGYGQQYADMHGYFSHDIPNITHLFGDSLSYDFKNLGRKFDVIFIDGSHHFNHIVSDTQNVFRHLVHNESIVVWHDYGYTPEKRRPEVIAAIIEGTPHEYRASLYHVSNTKSAIFINKKYKSYESNEHQTPQVKFELNAKFSSFH